MATRTLQTVSETALQVRRCLDAAKQQEALRWVAQFVDEFDHASQADRSGLVAAEPPNRSLHASAFVSTPPALANRGVFIHESSLRSV